MIILQFSHSWALISLCIDWREAISAKEFSRLRLRSLFLWKNYTKQHVLTTQGILKFVHLRRKTIVGEIITYIRIEVEVRVVLWRSSLGHEAQPGEVAFLLLVVVLLIFFWTWWVFTWEVEVAQGCTCSEHDLLLVSEAILLLVVLLVIVIVGVVILVGVVTLLPLGVVSNEVGGVIALEVALGVSGVSSPLLPKYVHRPKFASKAISSSRMLSYCSSEAAAREGKAHSKEGEMVLVGLASWPPTRALVIKALLVKEASW
jgi:hypothetical protein